MRVAGRGLIDRGTPVEFSFDGIRYSGFQGDTLASALLANGERFVARSFKYHRPRGIFSAGSEEPSALVHLRSGAAQEPSPSPSACRPCTLDMADSDKPDRRG